jgi:indolepyruvate ferredoxin oxidoreductase beta subunit
MAEWAELAARAGALPPAVTDMAAHGLAKVVDYQDTAYGAAYLDRLEALLALDRAPWDFTREAAKHLANAMSYDDVIRVADLKTRGTRFARIRDEMGVGEGQVMQVTEFMHPRAEEVAGMLPRRMGERISASPRRMARLDRWFGRGRRLRTNSIPAFLVLWLLGGMKRYRLRTLRHAQEVAHMEAWLATATGYLGRNDDLAVEILRCRRLIKGYSDTHARGLSKYDRVLAGIALVADRPDAADWARRLREAALADEAGKALDGALDTIRSFA